MDDRTVRLAHDIVAARLRPEVKLVRAVHGAIGADVLLGLQAGAEDDLEARPSCHDGAGDHDHDDFTSFTVEFGPVASPRDLVDRLRPIIAEHDILRVKGFAAVSGKGMRLVVQGVGSRIQHYYDRDWRADGQRRGRLVVIGQTGLDPATVAARIGGWPCTS
jgi:cobalamin biosynthesis protein CobW